MPIATPPLQSYFGKIGELRIAPSVRHGQTWKLQQRNATGISWQPEVATWRDWHEPLFGYHDSILAWDEAARLVLAIHEATGADVAFVRGALLDIAAAFLQNSESMTANELITNLARETYDLFTAGLPVNFRSFLSGIKIEGSPMNPRADVTLRPFSTEDWPAHLDPSTEFGGVGLMDCAILEIQGRLPALGQPFDPFDPKAYHWQRQIEQVLRILRFYRVGGVQSVRTQSVPTTLIRIPLHGQFSAGPRHASPFEYTISSVEGEALRAHFEFLSELPPWKIEDFTAVDIAMERYESAIGPGKFTEEILLHVVIGLEALFRRRSERRLLSSRRLALFLELAGLAEKAKVQRLLEDAYRFRNPYVHGEVLEQSDVNRLQPFLVPLLDCLRISILLFLGLGPNKESILARLEKAESAHGTRRTRLGEELRTVAHTIHLQLPPL